MFKYLDIFLCVFVSKMGLKKFETTPRRPAAATTVRRQVYVVPRDASSGGAAGCECCLGGCKVCTCVRGGVAATPTGIAKCIEFVSLKKVWNLIAQDIKYLETSE